MSGVQNELPASTSGRSLSDELWELIRAGFSGIWIETHEASEAILELSRQGHQRDLRIMHWNLDPCLPSLDYSRYEVAIAEDDADYLLANLDRMIDSEDCLANLTLTAERRPGQPPRVILRFRSRTAHGYSGWMQDARHDHSQTPQCVELDLAGSTFERGPMQIAIHHRHLLNALRLGMRQFHVHQSAYTLFSHAWTRSPAIPSWNTWGFLVCDLTDFSIPPATQMVRSETGTCSRSRHASATTA